MRLSRLAAAGFATLVAGPTLADTLGAQAHYALGQGSFDGVELSAPAALDEPQLLEGTRPRLRGMGALQGGSLRADLLLDRWRLGAGTSLFSVSDVRLATDALPFGVTARVDKRFGALIPIGHSLMLDVNVYRQILGGFEQLTLSVGVGYWENDRRDDFSERLKRSPRGDF